jgi:hypothetical protein
MKSINRGLRFLGIGGGIQLDHDFMEHNFMEDEVLVTAKNGKINLPACDRPSKYTGFYQKRIG